MSTKSVKSFDDFGDSLEKWAPSEKDFTSLVDKIGLEHGKDLVDQIKLNPPYKNKSGELNKANKVVGGRGTLTFINDAVSDKGFPYAIPLHDGSGLYGKYKRVITPKVAEFLVFKIGNSWIKTKSVKGVKPMKWFTNTWTKKENIAKLVRELLKASDKVFKV